MRRASGSVGGSRFRGNGRWEAAGSAEGKVGSGFRGSRGGGEYEEEMLALQGEHGSHPFHAPAPSSLLTSACPTCVPSPHCPHSPRLDPPLLLCLHTVPTHHGFSRGPAPSPIVVSPHRPHLPRLRQ